MFKDHAQRFYHLFKVKYSTAELTPYMIKLIDMGRYFMSNLPFSLGRFQGEGGEHVNYIHNTFYYQHTTRHGGRYNKDPVVAVFNHMWTNHCYSISTLGKNSNNLEAATKFELYKRRHVAATKIQVLIKGWLARQKCKKKKKGSQ